MRRRKTKQYRHTFSFIILIMLTLSIITLSLHVIGQEEKRLYIAIFDCENGEYLDDDIGYIFLEKKQYDIEVYYEDDTGSPKRAYNVTIDLPWASFFIASGEENPWITIEAPNFEEYNEITLIASKPGYVSAEEYIMITKGELFVTIDRDSVEEDGIFLVTIKDQYDNPVSGAILYVEGLGSILDTTNENGRAHINAPIVESDTEISITAVKGGYFPGSETICVENIKTTLLGEIESKIIDAAPILFSIFAVIFAMIYAKMRNKKTIPISSSKIKISKKEKSILKNKIKPSCFKNTNTKKHKPMKINPNKNIMAKDQNNSKGPHIEIIRIRDNEDKKERTNIISKQKESKKIIIPKKNNDNEWFRGTDYVKYKIDKLTGEEDNTPENWFVGQDNTRFMVDQKLINKKQKKKTNTAT